LSANRAIRIIPYGHDPLAALAAQLLADHTDERPDFSRHIVLLPAGSISAFQRTLLRAAGALLPPTIASREDWLRDLQPALRTFSIRQRDLVFFSLLQRFPQLTARYGTWPLIDGLLALFDAITLNRSPLPATTADFEQQLAKGYGLSRAKRLAALSDEAQLVHTLYRAWHEDLQRQETLDPAAAQLAAMQASATSVSADTHLYAAGVLDWPKSAMAWLQQLPCRVTVLLQGRPDRSEAQANRIVANVTATLGWPIEQIATSDTQSLFFDQAFAIDGAPLHARAKRESDRARSIAQNNRLSIYQAVDFEQEARAVDLQVRRWWLAGKRTIGVVSNDRKFLRRLRALLERAKLPVIDRSGWPLSTTSASSAMANWLACIASNFEIEPMLDVLRSPFISVHADATRHITAVSAIESALIRSRTTARALDTARAMLAAEQPQLRARFGDDTVDLACRLLEQLKDAAAPLLKLHERRTIRHAQFCSTLRTSLDVLGVIAAYTKDDAGIQLLALLDELIVDSNVAEASGTWSECQHWLSRNLETHHFRTVDPGTGVELMTVGDAALAHYDALILAGCTAEHLPIAGDALPFFNDAVRRELGLRTLTETQDVQFNTFRRLLEAADTVLLTSREHDASRPATLSPWVERLQTFYELALGHETVDRALADGLADPLTLLSLRDVPLPEPAQCPHPTVARMSWPNRLSASRYQSLVDCPYQFFAHTLLGLDRPRPLEHDLSPADFGQLVHRCLQAFHDGLSGIPGPWRGSLDAAHLPAARVLLDEIAQAVFAPHLRRTITTRAWLYRWRDAAAAYLPWQVQRQRHWPTSRSEQDLELELPAADATIALYGRIDRIEEVDDRYAIVDYKTGVLPKLDVVLDGENVQLPLYSLLVPGAEEALFLGITHEGVDDRVAVRGSLLRKLAQAHAIRLTKLVRDLREGAPLPAHGDAETCKRCAVVSLCRRPLWGDPTTSAHQLADSHGG